jgi:hypothetical protein
VIISDNIANLRWAKEQKIEFWKAPNYLHEEPDLRNFQANQIDFRKGFWFHTSSRIFALCDYMLESGTDQVFHLESDVLLFEDFPFSKFYNLNKISFPMVSSDHAAASTLYIGSRNLASLLRNFMSEQINLDSQLTDMKILAKFQNAFDENVELLPVTLADCKSEIDLRNFQLTGSINIEKFGGLFDGATWGQYLFGLDPRNHWGFIPLFNKIPFHIAKPENFIFKNFGSHLEVSSNGVEFYKIFSLHIHSKDLNAFDDSKRIRILSQRLSKGNLPRKEIKVSLFVRFIPRMITYYTRLNLKKLLKFLSQ